MDKTEKRFERDIESFLISPAGGYTQFCVPFESPISGLLCR